jgi:hypothetical protein
MKGSMPLSQSDPTTQFMLSPDATWAGAVLLIIAGLFLSAIVIGWVSRVVLPERHALAELE